MEHYAESQSIVVSFNGETKTFSGKPFGDLSVFPVELNDDETDTTVVVDFDTDINEFVCDIDEVPYEKIPKVAYECADFSDEVK